MNKDFCVDVGVCKKCKWRYLHDKSFVCCGYMLTTGKKRDHNGLECYSFEDRSVKRRKRKPPVEKTTVIMPYDIMYLQIMC